MANGIVTVHLNDGNGSFSAPVSTLSAFANNSVTVGDWNDDGDLDVAAGLATAAAGGDRVRVFFNSGNATFQTAVELVVGEQVPSLVSADLNGDNVPDLAAAGTNFSSGAVHGRVTLFISLADGTFAPAANAGPSIETGPMPGAGGIVGDLDADGDLDVVVTRFMLLNNGDGTFAARQSYSAFESFVAGGDLNDDGAMDLLTFARPGKVTVRMNGGDATFPTEIDHDLMFTNPRGAAVADLDGDGHRDVVVTSGATLSGGWIDTSISVFLNAGGGSLNFAYNLATLGRGRLMANPMPGDIDGDGDTDLVIGYDSGFALLVNDGGANFTITHKLGGTFGGRSSAIADLDGDGDLDLARSGRVDSFPFPGKLAVLLNDGSGAFGAFTEYPSGLAGVGAGDLDGDGDIDLAVSGFQFFVQPTVSVHRNLGDGTFIRETQLRTGSNSAVVAAVDLDGDGVSDIVGTALAAVPIFMSRPTPSFSRDDNNDGIPDECQNQAPVADAGPDQIIECSGPTGMPVSLDGSGTSNPDDDPLSYTWTGPFPEGGGTVTGINPVVTLGSGLHDIELVVQDDDGATASDTVQVRVQDTTAPSLNTVPEPFTVEQETMDGTAVTVPSPTASDACDPSPILTSDAPAVFPPGATTVTFTATDASGNESTATTTVTVVDTTAPSIESLIATPDELWPPNHRMVAVSIEVDVADISDAAPQCQLFSVSSNEPVDGLGDGDTSPDWEITGDFTLNLRAERSGTGIGRVYAVTLRCVDASGNVSTADVAVTVPHSRGNGNRRK